MMHPVEHAGLTAVIASRCPIYTLAPLPYSKGAGARLSELILEAKDWPADPYSVELWMDRYLTAGHPWIVPKMADAEVTLLLSNVTIACRHVDRQLSSRAWLEMRARHTAPGDDLDITLAHNTNITAHKRSFHRFRPLADVWPAWPAYKRPQTALTSHCGGAAPWFKDFNPASTASDSILHLGWIKHTELDINVPSAFSAEIPGAEWVADTSPMSQLPPYKQRPTVFFGGPMVKPYISKYRLQLWTELIKAQKKQTVPNQVTVQTSNFQCTVEMYEVCASEASIQANYATFCKASGCLPHDPENPCEVSVDALRDRCARGYATLDYNLYRSAPEMSRGLGPKLSQGAFMTLALAHRFCVIAPSENIGTDKVGEMVAIAAAGGCIPVLMMPDTPLQHVGTQIVYDGAAPPSRFTPYGRGAPASNGNAHRGRGPSTPEDPELYGRWRALPPDMRIGITYSQWAWMHQTMELTLPYTRWLDYCELGFVVPASYGVYNTSLILAKLEEIPEDRLRQMSDGARAAKQAFVFASNRRRGGGMDKTVKGVAPLPLAGVDDEFKNLAAQDFILAELCHQARHIKEYNISTRGGRSVAPATFTQHFARTPLEAPLAKATRLERCLILPN